MFGTLSFPSMQIMSIFFREGPLLVVASGRDTISVASSIKQLAPENVFVIQVKLYAFSFALLECEIAFT